MGSQFAPDTAEGWSVIHQFFNVDWTALNKLSEDQRGELINPLAAYIQDAEPYSENGQSAAFHVLGHKGQFLMLHFRKEFTDCAQVELDLQQLPISDYLTQTDSYVSVVELGMYHITKKIIQSLEERGVKPYSDEWKKEYSEKIEPHKENLYERRYSEIPDKKYLSFYPMSKRRGENHNWYVQTLEDRAKLMMEHGMSGRRFAGKVQQIITGSIGYDDWEWGVDLFADDPAYFKQLVYEMRFDDATSLYGDFGQFYLGVRVKSEALESYFNGTLPQ